MNIEMALKSRSYILNLDRVKWSFSELFNGEFFLPAFRMLFYVKNTYQKATNLMFRLILPMAKVSCLFCLFVCLFVCWRTFFLLTSCWCKILTFRRSVTD